MLSPILALLGGDDKPPAAEPIPAPAIPARSATQRKTDTGARIKIGTSAAERLQKAGTGRTSTRPTTQISGLGVTSGGTGIQI